MNKSEVLSELQKRLNCSEKECLKINNIIEDTFLIGKKNKEKMIERFKSELGKSE